MRYPFLLSLLLSFSSIVIPTYAQSDIFRVLITDGKPLFEEENKHPKKALKICDEIGHGNIILVEKSFISLIHESGNIIELTEQGIYSTRLLEKKLSLKPPAPISKLLVRDFLVENYAELRHEYMPVTGSICRLPGPFHIYDGLHTQILKDSVCKIHWSKNIYDGHQMTVKVVLSSLFRDTIFTGTTKDTVLEILPAFKEKIGIEHNQILTIINADKDSRDIRITVMNKKEETEYLSAFKQLKKELTGIKISSLLVLYIFYEKNHQTLSQGSCYNQVFNKINYSSSYSMPYFNLHNVMKESLRKSGFLWY